MQEIKCPKCGEVFQVDESGYAAIVKQVRDKEFEKEVNDRQAQFESEKESLVKLAKAETQQAFHDEITKKDMEIARLKAQLDSGEKDKKLAVSEAVQEKEKEIAESRSRSTS